MSNLTAEAKEIGARNFAETAGDLTRRDMMKSLVAGAAIVPVSAAVYYGYDAWKGNRPVRTALIGSGDQGCVLVGEHNPAFNEIVAVCDLRPSNRERIFKPDGPVRKGLNFKYGEATARTIELFDDVRSLLNESKRLGLEAVIIATPLNTHDQLTKLCMDAGLHVFCEKLMARTIPRCKEMIRYAQEKNLLLGIGHQRHYSTLYAHAVEVVKAGVLGDIKHIKAQWPRNNSWPYIASENEKKHYATQFALPVYRDGWFKPVLKTDAEAFTPKMAEDWGFRDVEQLVRWRLYDATGGGLMAELGSHQLDAASIFLGHVHPISVQGVGGKFFYGAGRNDRESDDAVFVNYEFPGPNHPKAGRGGSDESDIVVVSYTSFNTNEFEQYGECLMGSRGTMIVERESDIYLFKEKDKNRKDPDSRETKVAVTAEGGKPVLESSSTWGAAGSATVLKAPGAGAWDTPVRGYQTELEHFAFCVRNWDAKLGWTKKDGGFAQAVPRCHGDVALADAIVALVANMAMKNKTRIEFEEAWFDSTKDDNPEAKYVKG